jgi:hypothetical protein
MIIASLIRLIVRLLKGRGDGDGAQSAPGSRSSRRA